MAEVNLNYIHSLMQRVRMITKNNLLAWFTLILNSSDFSSVLKKRKKRHLHCYTSWILETFPSFCSLLAPAGNTVELGVSSHASSTDLSMAEVPTPCAANSPALKGACVHSCRPARNMQLLSRSPAGSLACGPRWNKSKVCKHLTPNFIRVGAEVSL